MNEKDWLEEIDKRIEKAKHDYKGPHCCLTMDRGLISYADGLNYDKQYREYGIKIPISAAFIAIDYCMFCGKELPSSLRHQWFDILEQEYGLESPMEEDEDKVPQEFWTDEWWKKRGL
jgi:hypothetical protein